MYQRGELSLASNFDFHVDGRGMLDAYLRIGNIEVESLFQRRLSVLQPDGYSCDRRKRHNATLRPLDFDGVPPKQHLTAFIAIWRPANYRRDNRHRLR